MKKKNMNQTLPSNQGIAASEMKESTDGIAEIRRPLNEAAVLRYFFGICRSWKLNPEQEQILLGVDLDTYLQWSGGEVRTPLPPQTLKCISYVFGIFETVRCLIEPEAVADAWVHTANAAPLFGGGTALQKMLSAESDDLRQVCVYLEAQLSGDFS